MVDDKTQPRWTNAEPATWRRRDETNLERFLGGSPAAVVVRLVVASLIVGAVLMWLDIRPGDLIRAVVRLIDRLWAMGLDAVRDFAGYIVAGAVIVVPLWFVMRLLGWRRAAR